MATLTGQWFGSALPLADTPGANRPVPDALSRTVAEAAWRSVAPSIAGTPYVRISRDGGRTYPARQARSLPAGPPGQPCTVPVYNPGSGTGRMLALDFDVARGDTGHQGAEPGELLKRLGARYIADVSPSGGRHIYVLFAAALPWLELRDVGRARALRFPAIDTAPTPRRPDKPSGRPRKPRWLAAAHDITGGCQAGRRASERAGLSPGGPVMVSRPVRPLPGLRGNGADPPLLSTMRHGTGRLRYVAPGYEPARRLTFGYRAGEDAERPLPSVHLEIHKALETPEAWHKARPSNENRIPACSDPLLVGAGRIPNRSPERLNTRGHHNRPAG